MNGLFGSLKAAKEVFMAYFKAELLRSKGIVFGFLSLSLWLSLFTAPLILFRPSTMPPETVGAYAFAAVLIFLSYSVATWDWAWQLRWLMFQGILEHVIASGRSILLLYVGIIPMSLMWYVAALSVTYFIIYLLLAPPALALLSPTALLVGISTMVTVLFAYSLLLGATTISTGTSGPMAEIVGWVLPIATGGLTPLSALPKVVQDVALLTPFSYPAELIRYSLGISEPVVDVNTLMITGPLYALAFLAISLVYFKYQLRKLLKEGIKTAAMW